MKIALLLTGLHYRDEIDFRYYIQNIKTYIYSLGSMDTFIFTNSSPIQEELSVYNPIYIEYLEDTYNRRISKTLRAMNYISNYDYDYICITRLDIYFLKPLLINFDQLNIISTLEKPSFIDDNFYFFPISLLPRMISAYSTIIEFSGAHNIRSLLDPINFIYDEKVCVNRLTTFKLRFFKQLFYMNFLYTNNVTYYNVGHSIMISNNIIHFKKDYGIFHACFIYHVNPGIYDISYDLISNSNSNSIILFNIIEINGIRYNNRITLSKPSDVYFIFDKYECELNLIFRNIRFIPYKKNKGLNYF